jgi:hypothetical protein
MNIVLQVNLVQLSRKLLKFQVLHLRMSERIKYVSDIYVSFLSTILFRNNVLTCNYLAGCLRDARRSVT